MLDHLKLYHYSAELEEIAYSRKHFYPEYYVKMASFHSKADSQQVNHFLIRNLDVCFYSLLYSRLQLAEQKGNKTSGLIKAVQIKAGHNIFDIWRNIQKIHPAQDVPDTIAKEVAFLQASLGGDALLKIYLARICWVAAANISWFRFYAKMPYCSIDTESILNEYFRRALDQENVKTSYATAWFFLAEIGNWISDYLEKYWIKLTEIDKSNLSALSEIQEWSSSLNNCESEEGIHALNHRLPGILQSIKHLGDIGNLHGMKLNQSHIFLDSKAKIVHRLCTSICPPANLAKANTLPVEALAKMRYALNFSEKLVVEIGTTGDENILLQCGQYIQKFSEIISRDPSETELLELCQTIEEILHSVDPFDSEYLWTRLHAMHELVQQVIEADYAFRTPTIPLTASTLEAGVNGTRVSADCGLSERTGNGDLGKDDNYTHANAEYKNPISRKELTQKPLDSKFCCPACGAKFDSPLSAQDSVLSTRCPNCRQLIVC